jgi:hypothetical protein
MTPKAKTWYTENRKYTSRSVIMSDNSLSSLPSLPQESAPDDEIGEPLDEETRASTVTVSCACGETFHSLVYHAVNVTLEPELLYQLLADMLNVAVCPNCGRRARSAIPFVYHDMARGLFAFVFPNGDLSDAERSQRLERLRKVYQRAVTASAEMTGSGRADGSAPSDAPRLQGAIPQPDAPPMQVIFGIEQLRKLVESLLEPAERLGKVTLTAHGNDSAQREQLRLIAQRLARGAGCLTEATERSDAFSITIYGPRSQIGVIAQALRQG